MQTQVRILGSESSSRSVKLLAFVRFKQLRHEWIRDGDPGSEAFATPGARRQLPAVQIIGIDVPADESALLEALDDLSPEPVLEPHDSQLAFVSRLLEEYGDMWLHKAMIHFRWEVPENRDEAACRAARDAQPDAPEDVIRKTAGEIGERMLARVARLGATPDVAGFVEASFHRVVAILDTHLADRRYLFGDRPCRADFGMFPPIHQCAIDPTPARILDSAGPNVLRWLDRMLEPRVEGAFDAWTLLEPTLAALLEEELAGVYLPWVSANARALEAGAQVFRLEVRGKHLGENVSSGPASSLAALRTRYWMLDDATRLDAILEDTDCLRFIVPED